MFTKVTQILLALIAMCTGYNLAFAGGTLSMYEGRHFLLGFMKNEIYTPVSVRLELRLYIATKRPTRVRVTMPWGASRNYALQQDSILTLGLDPSLEVSLSEIPQKAAVEVSTDEPVVVYALSGITYSSEAYAVIPTTAWGTDYMAMCMSNDQYNPSIKDPSPDSLHNKLPRLGEFMVIAMHDSTTVYYEPTAPTLAGIPAGSSNAILLNRGECVLVKSGAGPKNSNDLTGTFVMTDKPVGFLTGHMRTSIPHLPDAMDGQYDTKNHLIEMIPPIPLWGKHFVSAPYGVCSDGDYFRVVAAHDNTTLTMESETGTYSVTLNKGEFAEFENIATPAVWSADQPVIIGQYMYSDFLDPTTNADPSFVTLPPSNRFTKQLLFQAPATISPTQFNTFKVQLICTADALGSLTIDGTSIEVLAPEIQTQSIGTTGLHWAVVNIAPTHIYKVRTSAGSFSGIIFAHGPQDSYALSLGMSYETEQTDTTAPQFKAAEKCGIVKGWVREESFGSGIYELYIDAAMSTNYALSSTPAISDTTTIVEFTATPVDIYKDAILELVVVDRAGNEARYNFHYKAPVAAGDISVQLPRVASGTTVCAPVVFTNNGDAALTVTGLYSMSDPRASLAKQPSLPHTLAPGESLTFDICYTATADTAALKAQVLIRYGCDLQWWIQTGHTSAQPDIAVHGHDFGGVRVGDTTCAAIAVINTGLTPLLLTRLSDLALPTIYTIDTTGVFPYSLAVGDTLWLDVCFTPLARQPYTDTLTAENAYRLPNQFVLTGYGTAPDIAALNIDWQRRRVGTLNDTLLILTNRGTTTAIVTAKALDDTTAFHYSLSAAFPIAIHPGDSVKLPVQFAPVQPTEYSHTIEILTDWQLHPPVRVVVEGIGTLPTITTTDIMFDTLIVGTWADTTAEVLTAGGNEQLTVDTLFFADGDNSFIIAGTEWQARTLPTAGTSAFSVRFAPTRAGWHRARIGIVHDARPNYQRDTAYFEIAGFAIENDTINPELSLQQPDFIAACHEHSITLSFDNTRSNKAVAIDSLVATAFGIDTTVVLPAGTTVAARATLTLPALVITPDRAGTTTMRISVHYRKANDSEASPRISTTEQQVTVQRSRARIMPIADRDIVPWDTPTLYIQGELSNGALYSGALTIRASYNFQSFRPLHDTTTLVVVHSGGTLRIPATIRESRAGVIISTADTDIPLPAQWSVALPLFVFLDTVKAPDMTIAVQETNCLEGDSTSLSFQLTGVCALEQRGIRYRPIATVRLRPNPTADDAFVDISLPADDAVEINIVDPLGRSFRVAEKMYLKKGKYSYKLSTADLNSGLYSLVVILSDSVSLHHFLINK